MNGDNVTYFDSIKVEHIPKIICTQNIFRVQADDSMCGYFVMDLLTLCWKVRVC